MRSQVRVNAEGLWRSNRDLADACLAHPFVQGIASGELARERFQVYVAQDAYYLETFARAYSIAGAKAPDWKGFLAFHALAGGALEERRLHESYARERDVDLQAVEPGLATHRYTDFLLATAWGYDVGVTAAAMSPSMLP